MGRLPIIVGTGVGGRRSYGCSIPPVAPGQSGRKFCDHRGGGRVSREIHLLVRIGNHVVELLVLRRGVQFHIAGDAVAVNILGGLSAPPFGVAVTPSADRVAHAIALIGDARPVDKALVLRECGFFPRLGGILQQTS